MFHFFRFTICYGFRHSKCGKLRNFKFRNYRCGFQREKGSDLNVFSENDICDTSGQYNFSRLLNVDWLIRAPAVGMTAHSPRSG